MRNILARIASIVIIIAALAPCAALAAYDYYWFGGSDGSWTNTANWSSSPTEYVAVTRYPNSSNTSSGYRVHIDTSVAGDHHVTIVVPKLSSDAPACFALEIFDSTGSGTLTFVGEADENGRPYFPLAINCKPTWTETGHPMRLELYNLELRNGTLSVVENECAGCSVLVSNCVGTSTDNSYYMRLPGQHGGTVVIIDSEIKTQRLNGTSASDVAGYVFAVTNSTISVGSDCYVGGPGTVIDFFNSTLAFGMYAPVFGAAQSTNHLNMKISFRNSTIAPNGQFAYFFSAGGTLLFDNVVQQGDSRGFELLGIAKTELRNTSLRFYGTTENGYRGISGDLILDNSEWLSTNSARNIAINGPLRVEFRGRAPRFGGRQISASAGQPLTFDFLVPKGGYACPPVNRMDNPATGCIFPSSVVGGSINVLPESPALKVPGTLIQPLVYVKDSISSSQPVCNLANLPLTTLPNEKSKFLVTTDYSWEYADVNGKQESDWTEVATGYNKTVAGVAVKIVGLKPGLSIFVR
ncbi:MAG: hypothetical protein J5727_07100 [Kiritimatiellae bacterium]|nr:hypothetical protein [Kiritimatiellia bacterium]